MIKLNVIINEADTERLKQQKEYETVCNERDILGMQLIKRNDELSQLYEKIKIQESTLKKGETQYRHRLEDIKKQKDAMMKIKEAREKTIAIERARGRLGAANAGRVGGMTLAVVEGEVVGAIAVVSRDHPWIPG